MSAINVTMSDQELIALGRQKLIEDQIKALRKQLKAMKLGPTFSPRLDSAGCPTLGDLESGLPSPAEDGLVGGFSSPVPAMVPQDAVAIEIGQGYQAAAATQAAEAQVQAAEADEEAPAHSDQSTTSSQKKRAKPRDWQAWLSINGFVDGSLFKTETHKHECIWVLTSTPAGFILKNTDLKLEADTPGKAASLFGAHLKEMGIAKKTKTNNGNPWDKKGAKYMQAKNPDGSWTSISDDAAWGYTWDGEAGVWKSTV
jgi:hypothetical protein